MNIRKIYALGLTAAVAAVGFATFSARTASAHSGTVTASESCDGFVANVTLAHNVTSDRLVVVTTTIPGTVGIAGNHYNKSFGDIWDASGPQNNVSGTVTLKIYNGESLEFTASASISPSEDCSTPSPSPTATPTPTPTATPTPTPTPTPSPVKVTVTTVCNSQHVLNEDGNGSVTWSGLTVGDFLNSSSSSSTLIKSSTMTIKGLQTGNEKWFEATDSSVPPESTVASGTWVIASCPVAPPIPATGAGI